MKTLILALLLAVAGLSCKHASLAPGGAYSGVSGGVTNAAPDFTFYAVDAAYDLAYSAIDAAFKFERDNRIMLWKVSPDIKRVLDRIRPQAVAINVKYLAARNVYIANPTPANLTPLQTFLSQLQQISTAATAALPK